jgi:hypothetical protein
MSGRPFDERKPTGRNVGGGRGHFKEAKLNRSSRRVRRRISKSAAPGLC